MEKNEFVERLYALRAGISLLAMQYDKFMEAIYATPNTYLNMAHKFRNALNGTWNNDYLDRTVIDVSYCCFFYSGGKINFSYDKEHDARNVRFWWSIMNSGCVWNMELYAKDRNSIMKHYKKFGDIREKNKIPIGAEDFFLLGYGKWKRQFNKEPIKTQMQIRDFVDEIVKTKLDTESSDEVNDFVETLLGNMTGGQWLLTEEAQAHYAEKLKEINDIVNAIRGEVEQYRNLIEKFTPKGLVKIFNKNKNSEKLKYLKFDLGNNEQRLELGLTAVNNMKNAIALLEQEVPKARALIEEKEREMERAKAEYVLMLRALQEEFADVLDKRDWQDVDLLIYYFESGRADNLKEALLQVDNERRTNRIVDTIKEATDRICWTLKTGFETLNRTLQQGFAAIESRIKQQNVLLAKQNELIAQQNDLAAQQNAQLSNLVSAANLSNALLAKQNESSEQLVSKMTTLEHAIVG